MVILRTPVFVLLLTAPAYAQPWVCAYAQPWNRHTIDNSSRGADGVRLEDVNGDGLQDIATGWEEGGRIRIYLNPGPRKSTEAWPAATVGHVKSPEDAVFVDLDGDGADDVVSCCEGQNRSVFIHWAPKDDTAYLKDAAWSTVPIPCAQSQQAWMYALPMQIDGRHGPDLFVGSKGSGGSVGWLQAPDDPRAVQHWRFHKLCDAGWIMSLRPLDVDGDGDNDLLVSDRKGAGRGVFWLENPGNIAAIGPWREHRLGVDDREVMFLTTGKWEPADETSIIAAVKSGPFTILRKGAPPTNQQDQRKPGVSRPRFVRRGRAAPTSISPRSPRTANWKLSEIAMPDGCGTGKGVALGDIDLDGHVDLVFSCEGAKGPLSGVRWISSPNSNSALEDHEISGPPGTKFDRIELLDLDADGDLDALTCEERENLGVIWYENPTR